MKSLDNLLHDWVFPFCMSLSQLTGNVRHVEGLSVRAFFDLVCRPPSERVAGLGDMMWRVTVLSRRCTFREEVSKESISSKNEIHGSLFDETFDICRWDKATNAHKASI
jgi:hypothetical protein